MFSLTVYSRLDLERKLLNLFLSISPPHLSYLSSTKVLTPLAATLTLCNLLPRKQPRGLMYSHLTFHSCHYALIHPATQDEPSLIA